MPKQTKKPKETRKGGKRIPHPKGYIDKGLLYKGQVYPLFSDKQSDKSWIIVNSIKSKNINKKDLDRLKASLKEATSDREREEAYISFYKQKGIGVEVTEKVLQLANNRDTEKFIKGSTDEFQDFNKVVRAKVSIKVNKGDQETAPKVEEVSGQGLPKATIKPTKIEEPDDDKPSKEKQEETIANVIKDGMSGVVKYMVDGGYKIGVDALNALYDDLVGEDLRKAQRIADGATTIYKKLETLSPYVVGSLILKGIFPLYDPAVVYSAGLLLAKLDQTIKPKTLEQIENEVVEQKELNEIVESKRIEYDKKFIKESEVYLGKTLGEGQSTGFIGAGNIPMKDMVAIRAENIKKYMDMKGYKSTGEFTKEDIDKLFPDKARERKLQDEAMNKAIKDTPPDPVGKRETFGKGDPSKRNIKMEINEAPRASRAPPTPPAPAKQGETAEEVTEQIQERLMGQEGTAGYSPTTDEATGLDLDDEEDTGIHNEAIQRIATINDYDFSFTKKSLLLVNPLPNDQNALKKMGEKCIREYGFLLGILVPKDNYSKQEVEELYTLKHILKEVIRLEAQYKRALLKMRVSAPVASGSNQLDKLMSEGQLGLVLNAGSLNISPQQAVEQSSTSPVLPQQQQQEPKQGIDLKEKQQKPQMDVFEEMGMKKKGKKKKGRLNMEYKKNRKLMLKQPRNIVLRGRINNPPQYQNLRSEAERLNENPIPLAFKSNNRMNQMRRFNVNY